jgi:hypothetical protein
LKSPKGWKGGQWHRERIERRQLTRERTNNTESMIQENKEEKTMTTARTERKKEMKLNIMVHMQGARKQMVRKIK